MYKIPARLTTECIMHLLLALLSLSLNSLLSLNFYGFDFSPAREFGILTMSLFLNCNHSAAKCWLADHLVSLWEYEEITILNLAFIDLQLDFRNTCLTQSSRPAL